MTSMHAMNDSAPIAVIEGPKGKAEIYEYPVGNQIEYRVQCGAQVKTFNNLGEAYLEAGDLSGKET